jgi:hypothetical protein
VCGQRDLFLLIFINGANILGSDCGFGGGRGEGDEVRGMFVKKREGLRVRERKRVRERGERGEKSTGIFQLPPSQRAAQPIMF